MPEAFAVLFIFVVSVAAYIGAVITARDPARQNGREDLATLRQHRSWLQQRLDTAQRENWGDDMVEGLAAELHATAQQIAAREIGLR